MRWISPIQRRWPARRLVDLAVTSCAPRGHAQRSQTEGTRREHCEGFSAALPSRSSKGQMVDRCSRSVGRFRDSDNRPVTLLQIQEGIRLIRSGGTEKANCHYLDGTDTQRLRYSFDRQGPNRKLSVWELLAFGMRDSKRELIMIVLMGVVSGPRGMVFPIATGIIFDSVIPNAERGQLMEIASVLIVSALATSMFALTRSFAALRLQGKLDAHLQAALWDRLLRLPAPFFRRYNSPYLADRSLGIEYVLGTLTGWANFHTVRRVFDLQLLAVVLLQLAAGLHCDRPDVHRFFCLHG